MFARKTADDRLKEQLAKLIRDELNFEGDLRNLRLAHWQVDSSIDGTTFTITLRDNNVV